MTTDNHQPSTPNCTRSRPLKVLISAYACEPGKGSEPGCGWNYVTQVSRYCEVHVLTRQNNIPAIKAYEAEHGASGIRWIDYDLPEWVLRVKKRFNLVNLYYLLWQWYSVAHIRRELAEESYDILHHLTFGSYSKPTFLFRYKKVPFIWGPIGGIVNSRISLLRHASLRAAAEEAIRMAGQLSVHINPLFLYIKRHTNLVLGVSSKILGYINGAKTGVLSQVGINRAEMGRHSKRTKRDDRYTIFMAGRLIHWKGVALGLDAFARYLKKTGTDACLVIVGDGPDRRRLANLAESLEIGAHVDFKGNVDRDTFFKTMTAADVFMFPSTHEPGSYVVAEALAMGIPVICTDFGEPSTLVENGISGFTVQSDSYDYLADTISDHLIALEDESLHEKMSAAAIKRAEALSWENRGEMLYRYYCELSGAMEQVA